MSLEIIKAIENPATQEIKDISTGEGFLEISEFFCDTIQGEGVNTGVPATFLRLQHCSLNCSWCDTQEVWRHGDPYTFKELFHLMEEADLIRKLRVGQHLVLTGGSPIKQQFALIEFFEAFKKRYDFKPYIEIENECTIKPFYKMATLVDCWNNSPKLSTSGNSASARYRPDILKQLSKFPNSWFKFVITSEADWEEIIKDFLAPDLIKWEQVILMPCGAIRAELESNRQMVVDMAIRNNVRYSDRMHIELWDKKTGV